LIVLKEPQNQKDWNTYFNLRWKILRAPWNKPKGSEKDDLEEVSHHVMAISDTAGLVGVGRLHEAEKGVGQIRYMGVDAAARGLGVGQQIIAQLETRAKELRMHQIVLNAREAAVPFYLASGYRVDGKSYLMWDTIQHFKMIKEL